MIFGDLVGLTFPGICLTGEEKPRRKLIQEMSRPGTEPGPATRQARMLPPLPQLWTIIINRYYYPNRFINSCASVTNIQSRTKANIEKNIPKLLNVCRFPSFRINDTGNYCKSWSN